MDSCRRHYPVQGQQVSRASEDGNEVIQSMCAMRSNLTNAAMEGLYVVFRHLLLPAECTRPGQSVMYKPESRFIE